MSTIEEKDKQPEAKQPATSKDIPTVTPDNDNGVAGKPATADDSSNKGKGPKGENL